VNGWVTPDAPRPEELAACVECGLCLPHCPTFRLTGDETASPRGRLAAMAAVAGGDAALDGTFEEIMGFCLQCRACEAVCPSLVPFGRAMEGARAEVAAQRPTRARRLRAAVLGRVLGMRRLLGAATTAMALAQRAGAHRLPGPTRRLAGLRRLPLRPGGIAGRAWPAHGEERGTAAILAGCVMDPWFGPVHEATVAVLRAAGYRVEVPAAQTCCGALAAHDGAAGEARDLARVNVAAFAGYDVIVVDSAGCGAHLRDYGHWADGGSDLADRVRDVTEVVADAVATGVLPTVPASGRRVAVQDPCHLRHAQRVVEEPRAVLRAAGLTPVEIDPDGLCCGAAGVYTLSYPDASDELGRRKASQVEASGADLVASANPGCEMQLRSRLDPGIRVAHPVELYREAVGIE
jgi:glycolate oxidase iron-sulfur subunit